MLVYLNQQGCVFNEYTIWLAARAGRLAVCEFLIAEQCPCDAGACAEAAGGGYLEIVRFLHDNGCPWDFDTICERAAKSGSLELLQYLKQQGCVFTADAMHVAAQRGDLHICQYLRSEQCPWDASACTDAARGGHVDTLRWLHEQGCPWHVQTVRLSAAKSGEIPVIMYMVGVEPAASAAQLTEMLNAAGSREHLTAAQWLRQQGAEWPEQLIFNGHDWTSDVLQWARDEGCTSLSGLAIAPQVRSISSINSFGTLQERIPHMPNIGYPAHTSSCIM
jgi:hypothetical protein